MRVSSKAQAAERERNNSKDTGKLQATLLKGDGSGAECEGWAPGKGLKGSSSRAEQAAAN